VYTKTQQVHFWLGRARAVEFINRKKNFFRELALLFSCIIFVFVLKIFSNYIIKKGENAKISDQLK
jgi:hypothetical protein